MAQQGLNNVIGLTVCLTLSSPAHSANDTAAANFGADYAFLTLMTLSPDFAAANYTVRNSDGSEVDIAIARIPYHIELSKTDNSLLNLEIAIAHQQTDEILNTHPAPGEYIDATWLTTGASIGLLYEYNLTENLRLTPSFRIGYAKMQSIASYYGPLTNLEKNFYEGTYLNWSTNTILYDVGVGLRYQWQLADRQSTVSSNLYHIQVESYNESNSAVRFKEPATMLATNADMIFPTNAYFNDQRLDVVLLLGNNAYFGENRTTLGYTSSYQAGLGAELSLKWNQQKFGHIRLSGQVLWASNMNGWLLTIGYNPN